MAFKQGAGVPEVFFDVGLGGGDVRKGFVENTNDALLFMYGGEWDSDFCICCLI
jgi:hypothetical protein